MLRQSPTDPKLPTVDRNQCSVFHVIPHIFTVSLCLFNVSFVKSMLGNNVQGRPCKSCFLSLDFTRQSHSKLAPVIALILLLLLSKCHHWLVLPCPSLYPSTAMCRRGKAAPALKGEQVESQLEALLEKKETLLQSIEAAGRSYWLSSQAVFWTPLLSAILLGAAVRMGHGALVKAWAPYAIFAVGVLEVLLYAAGKVAVSRATRMQASLQSTEEERQGLLQRAKRELPMAEALRVLSRYDPQGKHNIVVDVPPHIEAELKALRQEKQELLALVDGCLEKVAELSGEGGWLQAREELKDWQGLLVRYAPGLRCTQLMLLGGGGAAGAGAGLRTGTKSKEGAGNAAEGAGMVPGSAARIVPGSAMRAPPSSAARVPGSAAAAGGGGGGRGGGGAGGVGDWIISRMIATPAPAAHGAGSKSTARKGQASAAGGAAAQSASKPASSSAADEPGAASAAPAAPGTVRKPLFAESSDRIEEEEEEEEEVAQRGRSVKKALLQGSQEAPHDAEAEGEMQEEEPVSEGRESQTDSSAAACTSSTANAPAGDGLRQRSTRSKAAGAAVEEQASQEEGSKEMEEGEEAGASGSSSTKKAGSQRKGRRHG